MAYHQIIIHAPRKFKKQIIALLVKIGSVGFFEQNNTVAAYFTEEAQIAFIKRELDVVKALVKAIDPDAVFKIEYSSIENQDWNAVWKRSFKPLNVGKRFVILPPWEKAPDGRISLIIDPGMAFGTGHHETTRSCLLMMEKYAPLVEMSRFLDIGTGTGLLAIAAKKIGFQTIVGIDIDPIAVDAARANFVLNKTTDIELSTGDISVVQHTFDMITANLISGTLIILAKDIYSRLAKGGVGILSGVLNGQEHEVIDVYLQSGMMLKESVKDGKWITIVVSR